MVSRRGLGVIGLLCLLSPSSCVQRQWGSRTTGKAREHAVHNLRLQETMRDLLRPVASLPQEMDLDRIQRRRLADTSRTAAALARAAREIPSVIAEVELSEESRKDFLGLTERLYQKSIQLQEAADAGDLRRVDQLVDSIDRTCRSCHARFRILPAADPGTRGRAASIEKEPH